MCYYLNEIPIQFFFVCLLFWHRTRLWNGVGGQKHILRFAWRCSEKAEHASRHVVLLNAWKLCSSLPSPPLPPVGLPLLAASVTFTSRWQRRRQLTCSKAAAAAAPVSKQDGLTRTGVFVFSWGPRRREKHQAEKKERADLYSFEINDTSLLLASIRTSEDLLT